MWRFLWVVNMFNFALNHLLQMDYLLLLVFLLLLQFLKGRMASAFFSILVLFYSIVKQYPKTVPSDRPILDIVLSGHAMPIINWLLWRWYYRS